MKVELNPQVRIKAVDGYEALKQIRERISDKILAEFAEEVSALESESRDLIKEEKQFRAEAQDFLQGVSPSDTLRVKTQTGRGSDVIREYDGHLQKVFGYGDTWFNFISPTKYDGKPFTIGLSCLLSVEVLDKK